MKAHKVSLINSLTLIIFGLWGSMSYFQGTTDSWTPLIPVFLGTILLVLNSGLKKENKIIAHIAVVVTLLSFGNMKPLIAALNESPIDIIRALRPSIMLLSSLIAMITFVRSFIDARKSKKS